MKISNRTILITGGGSGIGYETAKLLSQDNKVIIVGRSVEKLKEAAASLNNTTAIQCDITNEDDINNLAAEIGAKYSDLSVLVNNAGIAFAYQHSENAGAFDKAKQEMETNYFSLIRLTEKLLPILKSQAEAAIANVSSIVAFTPWSVIPTYSDSKAAVHSYTLALRHTLAQDSNIKVFELMPPTVNTEFSKEVGGDKNGMPPADVAKALIEGFNNDQYEIHVGMTAQFRDFFFSDPQQAFNMLNSQQ
ncbi:SDR family NAD(P)-dependent oxidoreductase [Mucilaginibacter sp. cycad4]|uniref:SDR family oxidoreductase n=1 Tax=Mucilaginibacter sp. cycad4 TaxID=3342096 RepID=UPI002AAA9F3F|nr:SDR family NAD(P)-dependent oxidoreductase [Mucilaginibacter gossypii]WPU99165.1 SDR family NAD(P)-dependent oxidoreductase [Mucilaginibacter gossypii]